MKKIILLVLVLILFTGCTNIYSLPLDDVVELATEDKIIIYNQHRQGYKYYIPRGMRLSEYNGYNEILTDSVYTYYMYFDVVGFINKTITDYEINDEAYFSTLIDFHDKYGYVEINLVENDKYLVEIIYNYAKIEVLVNKLDINSVLFNGLSVLSSIYYNEIILSSINGENILNYTEKEYKIYEPENENNYLDYEDPLNSVIEDNYDFNLIN